MIRALAARGRPGAASGCQGYYAAGRGRGQGRDQAMGAPVQLLSDPLAGRRLEPWAVTRTVTDAVTDAVTRTVTDAVTDTSQTAQAVLSRSLSLTPPPPQLSLSMRRRCFRVASRRELPAVR